MTELDLRQLVRDAVERHLGHGAQAPGPVAPHVPLPAHHVAPPVAGPVPHVAHGLYVSLVNTTDECVIEPSVRCDHCGYCKSHGY